MNKEKLIRTISTVGVAGLLSACGGTPDIQEGDCLWFGGRVAVQNGGIVRTVHMEEKQRINYTKCVDENPESINLRPDDSVDGTVEFGSGRISRVTNISGSGQRVWELEQNSINQ